MLSAIFRWVFKAWGWKLKGVIPNHIAKKVYVTIPHTSNWDFPVGILLKFGYNMDVQFLIKNSYMNPITGWFFKMLGGIGVERSKSTNFVDSVVDTFSKHEKISISVAPEGTRKRVEKLKSGFYWIAYKAEVPLIFVIFDWGIKTVTFVEEPFYPTGDYKADLKVLREVFAGAKGAIPEYGWPTYGV